MCRRYFGPLFLALLLAGCVGQPVKLPETKPESRPDPVPQEVPEADTDKSQEGPAQTDKAKVGETLPRPTNQPEPQSEAPEVVPQPHSDEHAKQAVSKLEQQVLAEFAQEAVRDLCERIGNKLGSVNVQDCLDQPFVHAGTSTNGLSLAYRDYAPVPDRKPLGRVLVLGGIHGDEFSSVSVVFKWLKILDQYHSGLFHWRFVPVTNPDGLLKRKSQRQNAKFVDLNRNFPTADWSEHAHAYWEDKTHSNPRRYPGPEAASEVETRWIIEQIATFQPDVIISMHAPYHLVDYDGPPEAPANLGGLYLRKLGVYPG